MFRKFFNRSDTQRIHLAYGREGLEVELPKTVDVIQPARRRGLEAGEQEEWAALTEALRSPTGTPPLRELARPGMKVVIVHSDITRATPNARILPPLLMDLEVGGVDRNDITLLNGLGTLVVSVLAAAAGLWLATL